MRDEMTATEVINRQELKKVELDMIIFGTGVYKKDNDGTIKHIPIQEFARQGAKYDRD